tara:strand:+ start:1569 stop:1736 length:168 start_codon:yes stop_codon:yes gene_type:complete
MREREIKKAGNPAFLINNRFVSDYNQCVYAYIPNAINMKLRMLRGSNLPQPSFIT